MALDKERPKARLSKVVMADFSTIIPPAKEATTGKFDKMSLKSMPNPTVTKNRPKRMPRTGAISASTFNKNKNMEE
jgi:hypothetical protein